MNIRWTTDDVRDKPAIQCCYVTIAAAVNGLEKSRRTFEEPPVNHPYARFTAEPSADMDRGG